MLYFSHCSEALELLEGAEATISQSVEAPRGTLKVTAPVWCASTRFVAALAEYLRRYPDVIVDLRLENKKTSCSKASTLRCAPPRLKSLH